MQVTTPPITITATGYLTVTVTPRVTKGYVAQNVWIDIFWGGGIAGPYTITVSFGDGTSDTLTAYPPENAVSVVHKYSATGTKTISVTVKDEGTGASGSGSATVQIAAVLTASLTASPITGNIPLTVTFTIGYGGGFAPYSATLDPADGSTPYSVTAGTKTHIYNKTGVFAAKLVVSDSGPALAMSQANVFAGMNAMQKAALATAGVLGIIAVAYVIKKRK